MVFTQPGAKPDTRKLGMRPMNVQGAFALMTAEDPNDLRTPRRFRMDQVRQQAQASLQLGAPFVINCEQRWTDSRLPNGEALARGCIYELSWVLDQARSAAPGVQVTLCGTLPLYLNLANALDDQIAALEAANDLLVSLIGHVDFTCPMAYLATDGTTKNTLADFEAWMASLALEHGQMCRKAGRQVPCYPMVWYRYNGPPSAPPPLLEPGLFTEILLILKRTGFPGAAVWDYDTTTKDATQLPVWHELSGFAQTQIN